jgi:formylglycine-generating enzyme required for sulfatase activity
MSRLCLTLSFFLLLSLHVQGTLPVPYSGKVSIRGNNYSGRAQFVFSLLDSNAVVHWHNGQSEQNTLNVLVENGRYTVLLGGQGMNPLPPQLFVDHNELYLKVLFDNGDGQGMRHLVPDQQITATPRALVAEIAKVANTAKVADSVKAGTITTAQLNEQILKYLKPEITASPVLPQERAQIYSGQSFTLSGSAEGKYLTYQWYRNGQPISGATGKSLQISDVNASQHNGTYSLTVSNDFGSVESQSVQFEVNSTRLYHTVPSASDMEMIWVEPGTFTMGQAGYETNHQVTLTQGYYLGKFEVTQAQYEAVMTGNSQGLNAKPSRWLNNDQRPVEKVSWEDTVVFFSRLNQLEQAAGRLPTGWQYVLPTEAQWEYACRAGTTSLYSWGNDINSTHANYNWDGNSTSGNDPNQTVNVGQYASNSWGFFDMHGNVREWVYDWHATYSSSPQTDPTGPATGSHRV